MTETLQTILLGIVEGITEFLPISSTGHLIITEHWFIARHWATQQRSDIFNVGIQAGAILAVIVIFWPRLYALLTGWRDPGQRRYFAQLVFAFLVTSIGGLIANKLGAELPKTLQPIAIAWIVGGVLILVVERLVANRPVVDRVTWNVAFWVGACQILAGVFPGISRSAATIFAAMLAGLTSRAAATEFAFLVGIPTMFAATGYELLKGARSGTLGLAGEDWGQFALGFVVSGVVAFIAVKWLLHYIQAHRFTLFAWYRIALGVLVLALV
ncbi:MAG TPA: undecaprenyl-diphosphate phosphatase [Steroidobacteraceae bacterium]|nr:undecaprenyl-diphosphate phosphatase [Steroidobacteraceae bacterium]